MLTAALRHRPSVSNSSRALLAVTRRIISYLREVDGVPKPGAFSRATTHNGLVYVSGTGASNDTASGPVEMMTAADETRGALENISKILNAANTSIDRIVSATMLLSDPSYYAECNEAYVAYLAQHGCAELPSRATALWGVPTSAKVAFSCVAAVPTGRDRPTWRRRTVQLREEYERASLEEASCGDEPFGLFRTWFDAAVSARIPEPNAMALTTVDALSLKPSTRVVLLKGYGEGEGFQFFTNYTSRKAHEIASTDSVALTFIWLPLERQVRVEGVASRMSAAQSEAYFRSRPRASQIGAWVSRQSSAVACPNELSAREGKLMKRFEGGDVPMPDFWGGYTVEPSMVEFWQGRKSRLHDRICFKRADGGGWTRERLCP